MRTPTQQLHEAAVQVSAARSIPMLDWLTRTAGAAVPVPSSSCSTRAYSRTIDISTWSSNTRRPTPRTSASGSKSSTAAAMPRHSTSCRSSGSATRGDGTRLEARSRAIRRGLNRPGWQELVSDDSTRDRFPNLLIPIIGSDPGTSTRRTAAWPCSRTTRRTRSGVRSGPHVSQRVHEGCVPSPHRQR